MRDEWIWAKGGGRGCGGTGVVGEKRGHGGKRSVRGRGMWGDRVSWGRRDGERGYGEKEGIWGCR